VCEGRADEMSRHTYSRLSWGFGLVEITVRILLLLLEIVFAWTRRWIFSVLLSRDLLHLSLLRLQLLRHLDAPTDNKIFHQTTFDLFAVMKVPGEL
jgi:hypothetical protein